jgi:hypothetical protein
MSGPFGSSQWMYQSAAGFYPTEIEQSLRIDSSSNAYLSRTPASSSNRKTWTWSGWVKREGSGKQNVLISAASGTSQFTARIDGGGLGKTDQFVMGDYFNIIGEAAPLFRDFSSWYHFVVAVDTTQATTADRIKFYVNGEQVALSQGASWPAQNADLAINQNHLHKIGYTGDTEGGYFGEVNFIDGQALDPTDFGEFKSGVWVAKSYAGSYGTNGFYLNFSDSANIGDDLSGNANDWTANNLVATDVVLDSPTNNFAVLNAIYNSTSADCTLSEGNLKATGLSGNNSLRVSSFLITGGKWYVEAQSFGMPTSDGTSSFSAMEAVSEAGRFGWRPNGSTFGLTGSPTFASYQSNDVLGMAIDFNNTQVTFYKNNVVQGSGAYTWTSSAPAGLYVRTFLAANTSYNYYLNFGQDSSFAGNKTAQGNTDDNGVGDFYYAPPSGYLALCTANLPDPVIDPAQDESPSDYFNTVLYAGNGTGQSITGVGFQPSWTWIKSRTGTQSHFLFDEVRGAGVELNSNSTDAETTDLGLLSSFDTDGFSLGSTAGTNSLNNYVAWNWLAGNGTSSNTDGSITSTVSVNQKAGFSIATFTTTGADATIGHGLGQAPNVIFAKSRNSTYNWDVYHSAIPDAEDKRLILNSTAAVASSSGWNNTAPTSSVVHWDGAFYGSGYNVVMYCFAEVEGYSKFGSYTGNGSTDGPFVYCGFRPAFVIFKATNNASSWVMQDNTRDTYNPTDKNLYANLSNAEDTGDRLVDFLSNGFKPRLGTYDPNKSGYNYIFMAFAEQPAKYSNAR